MILVILLIPLMLLIFWSMILFFFFKKSMVEESLAKVLIMDDPNLLFTKEIIEALIFLEASLPKET